MMSGREWKEYLDEEIDEETFKKDLAQFMAWVSKRKRSRASWFFALADWMRGDR